MKVKWIQRTCYEHPEQWEGGLVDGRLFYARYRSGFFRIYLGRAKDVFDIIDDNHLFFSTKHEGYIGNRGFVNFLINADFEVPDSIKERFSDRVVHIER